MGNNVQCCQTPITNNILDGPYLSQTESQIRLFLKRNPHIQEILCQKHFINSLSHKIQKNNQLYKNFVVLLESYEPVTDIQGTYIGQSNNQKAHGQLIKDGQGIMLYKDGQLYYGSWQTNARTGTGILIYNDGDYYQGEWDHDQPNRQGIYVGKNPQRKYEGSWTNGKQQGEGTEYYGDGSFYTGTFKLGLKNGKGKMVYKDGTFYQGDFVNNRIQGYGVSSGLKHRYEGQFLDGRMHGTGKSQWLNEKGQVSATYIGQYQNGVKHGFGQYRWGANRKTYKGKWENGQIKNTEVMFDIDSPNKWSMVSH